MSRSTLTPQMEALIVAAGRAPSSHNTQPWLFAVDESTIELRADRTRALPVNDPHDRELVISCGAALFNLRVAASNAGLAPLVSIGPDGDDPDLLAVVELRKGGRPTSEEEALGEAIVMRCTHRDAFAETPLPEAVVQGMTQAAADEGAELIVVEDTDLRSRVASLVLAGDRRQFNDPQWRRELALWMHVRSTGDGLPVNAIIGGATRTLLSHVDLGDRVGAKDAGLVESSPLLAIVATEADDQRGWVDAGQALEHVLLLGAWQGVQAGFVNQPCQVQDLRPLLRSLLPQRRSPQVVLRLGYPETAGSATPRREVTSVLL